MPSKDTMALHIQYTSAYYHWNSETLCQAPSLSTTTSPIVILTGLFEALSHSSVYLDFVTFCQWGHVILISMTHIGLTSELTSICNVPLISIGFDINVCSMPCQWILSVLTHVTMAFSPHFGIQVVDSLQTVMQTKMCWLKYVDQRLHSKIH